MHTRSFTKAPLSRAALPLTAIALLSACSPQGYFDLDNQSGRDVLIESRGEAALSAPAGKVTTRLSLDPDQVIRAGDCSYSYKGLTIAGVSPRIDRPLLGAANSHYQLRLDPDYTLRLFNASEGGQLQAEMTQGGWPAKPQVECRSKG